MSEKAFKIVGNDLSDGYHTFDELYDHRCLLFLAWMHSDGFLVPFIGFAITSKVGIW